MSVKEKLLAFLEAQPGVYLSGEKLAGDLNCSRAAVWKGIKSLRSEGYEIDSITNKGYALVSSGDILSSEQIKKVLKESVPVYVEEVVSSTNQLLKKMVLEQEYPHGTTVLAEEQQKGRGRGGKDFYSPCKTGLYLSVLLKIPVKLQDSLRITAAAAVAVCLAAEEVCEKKLDIKWVNDLYLDSRKVCGILSEAVTDFESGIAEYVIVGIGLNVYTPSNGFPQGLKEKAGALLAEEEGKKVRTQGGIRNRLAAAVISHLLDFIQREDVFEEYIRRNIVPGHRISIWEKGKKRQAQAVEILSDGRLLIKEETGESQILSYGEISIEEVLKNKELTNETSSD